MLLTIKQSLTKLQKQIKKILVIMSMSPPPSKPSTLEKKQVTRMILIMLIMLAIMGFFEILLKILIQTNIIFRIAFFSRHSFFSRRTLPFLVMLQRGPACCKKDTPWLLYLPLNQGLPVELDWINFFANNWDHSFGLKWTVAKSSGIILFAIDWDLQLEGWSVDFLPFRRLAIFFLSLCCLSSF